MKYIKNVETLEELKKVYKKLALKMHPDCGGNEEEMKVLHNEYQEVLDQQEETPAEFKDILNILFTLKMQDVTVEIVGSFIWLTGNTKPYKDKFKELGFRYSPKKYAWYKAPKNYKKRSYKNYNMNDIRSMYGSKTIKKEEKKEKLLQA